MHGVLFVCLLWIDWWSRYKHKSSTISWRTPEHSKEMWVSSNSEQEKSIKETGALAKNLSKRTTLLGHIIFSHLPPNMNPQGNLTSHHFLSSLLVLISHQEPTCLNITLNKRESKPSTKKRLKAPQKGLVCSFSFEKITEERKPTTSYRKNKMLPRQPFGLLLAYTQVYLGHQ